MRDGVSDGLFTSMAHDTHPVDLMCLYRDWLDVVEGASAEARAYRWYVARLRGPLPLRVGQPVRPAFGTRTQRRSVR